MPNVYEPCYQSLFSDTEQTAVWKAMKRLVYIPEKIIEHRNPAVGNALEDSLYRRNNALFEVDKATFISRSENNFYMPTMWLSICIATMPARREMLDRLIDFLYSRIVDAGARREVEVLVDFGKETTGEKRQRMAERAVGRFVSFVDDDDLVSHDYVSKTLKALKENPDADCASLVGIMLSDGKQPTMFNHSIKHTGWYAKNGTHLRSPNHLNAVKRELAIKAGFEAITGYEDFGYSQRLLPLLKNEVSTGHAPLYFYLYNSKGENVRL